MNTPEESLVTRLLHAKPKGGPSPTDVAKLISLLSDGDTEHWNNADQCSDRVDQLHQLHLALTGVQDLKTGAIVCWKDGLKNRKRPAYGEPAIVVDVLKEPVFDTTDDAGSQYFREPLTVVLGVVNEGDFIMFHYDGRRFKLLQPAS